MFVQNVAILSLGAMVATRLVMDFLHRKNVRHAFLGDCAVVLSNEGLVKGSESALAFSQGRIKDGVNGFKQIYLNIKEHGLAFVIDEALHKMAGTEKGRKALQKALDDTAAVVKIAA